MQIWRQCRQRKPQFRAIYRLSPAPRARWLDPDQRFGDIGCDVCQHGYNNLAHHMKVVNDVARKVVEASGFEVRAWACHYPVGIISSSF